MRNVDCTQLDVFKPFFDAYYFNCFTFDASSMFKSSTTRMFGLENGLTLMLFVDSAGHVRADGIEGELGLMLPGTQESDLTLASGRGVRVIVHTPGKKGGSCNVTVIMFVYLYVVGLLSLPPTVCRYYRFTVCLIKKNIKVHLFE